MKKKDLLINKKIKAHGAEPTAPGAFDVSGRILLQKSGYAFLAAAIYPVEGR